MTKQWWFKFRNLSQRLWFRAASFGLLAVVSSLAAVLFDFYVPEKFADLAGGDAVDNILTMMASSMLIVLTFALSTMVAAYSSATQHATPRATRLIKNDSKSHSAISIFLGAFIYSVVSLIALSTDYYGEKGRVILLMMTVAVLSSVVWVIIRWVDELKEMGSVHETIMRVERATSKALKERAKRPTFECSPMLHLPSNVFPIMANEVGHIQNIDIELLGDLAQREKFELYVQKDVGAFVHLQTKLIFVRLLDSGLKVSKDMEKEVRKAFTIGTHRTFASDPLYGVAVMSGIGIKAMSPSLNDPGTAIDVVSSMVRVLSYWDREKNDHSPEEPKYKAVFFPELKVDDLFYEAFYNLIKESIRSFQVTKNLKEALEIFRSGPNIEFRRVSEELIHELNTCAEVEFKLPSDLQKILSPTKNLH